MASRKTNEMKQRLLDERDALLRQKEAIENQIAGIERAISLIGGDEPAPAASAKRGPSNKAIVLDLLKEVGTTGLNAGTAVSLANNRGVTLDRNSVSSMLSRLKRDGVVVYDGEKYRLKEFAPKETPEPEQGSVFDLARAR